MRRRSNTYHVFSERPVDGEAAEDGIRAYWFRLIVSECPGPETSAGITLLEPLSAELALAARVCEPLNPHAVPDLHGRPVGVLADGDNDPDALDTLRISSARRAETRRDAPRVRR